MKSVYSPAIPIGIAICVLLSTYSARLTAQSLYWNDLIPNANGNGLDCEIKRANLDGSGASIIADTPSDGLNFIHSIAYEPVSNQLYWTDRNRGLIQEANPNGSNVHTVVSVTVSGQPSSVRGLALDSTHSTMYWTDEIYDTISRAKAVHGLLWPNF